jgi:uncharacterized protein (DUF1499 family)
VALFRRRRVLTTVAIVISIAAACIAGMFLLSVMASPPSDLGVRDGRLAKCPDSPNCVSTQAEDRDHWIAPLTVQKDSKNAIDVLEGIVLQLPRTQIIEKSPNYLRAEFRSAFFRFVDDVEFYVETESGHVHFRSASRVGRSDLGVNRVRMEQIRSLFHAAQPASTSSAVSPAKSSDLQPVR